MDESLLSDEWINEAYIAATFTEAGEGEIAFARAIESEVLRQLALKDFAPCL